MKLFEQTQSRGPLLEADRGSIFKLKYLQFIQLLMEIWGEMMIDSIPQCNGVYFSARSQCLFSKKRFIFFLQVYTT